MVAGIVTYPVPPTIKSFLRPCITDKNKQVGIMHECLRKPENFWIKILEPSQAHRLNHKQIR